MSKDKPGTLTIGNVNDGAWTNGQASQMIFAAGGGNVIVRFTSSGEIYVLGERVKSFMTEIRVWSNPPKT